MSTLDEDPDNRPEAGDDRILPPTWAESHRFVPQTFIQPTLNFLRTEAAGGIVMLVAAVIALVWANSPVGDSYFAIFDTRIEIAFGDFHFHHLSELTVREWVNDALMVVFFFVVGLEIKREVVAGDLRDPRSAALPVLAALGGMLVPALLYLVFNVGTETARGWGIPMATDIAFAVGVVSMIGSRVPVQAKLFLLALAIADDLGAILVIAIFYTDELAFGWLGAAAAGLVLVGVLRRISVRSMTVYLTVGAFVWLAVLESGVHATIAGVALAFMTPVSSYYAAEHFPERARRLLGQVEEYLPEPPLYKADHHTLDRISSLLDDLGRLARETVPPLDRAERALNWFSSYLVVPVFALANAGVIITGDALGGFFEEPVIVGVAVGLFVGKVLGVSGFAWLGVRLGWAQLPQKTTWNHVVGVGFLSGIGFTVALFVSALAFPAAGAAADNAKIGIFAASLASGIVGYVWLRFVSADPGELDRNRDGVLDSRQPEVLGEHT